MAGAAPSGDLGDSVSDWEEWQRFMSIRAGNVAIMWHLTYARVKIVRPMSMVSLGGLCKRWPTICRHETRTVECGRRVSIIP